MRLLLAVCVALVASGCEERKAQPPGKAVYTTHPLTAMLEATPRNAYERTLSVLVYQVAGPDALQLFCSRWYPEFGQEVAASYLAWRRNNEASLAEILARGMAVWTSNSGGHDEYVQLVYPHIRKEVLQGIMKEFDASPAEKMRDVCRRYPGEMRSPAWNLERRFSRELLVLRERPAPAPR